MYVYLICCTVFHDSLVLRFPGKESSIIIITLDVVLEAETWEQLKTVEDTGTPQDTRVKCL
jgi:hypothetical protein